MQETDPVLAVADLSVEFPVPDAAPSRVVDQVSLTVRRGETLGMVGESGSGKTMMSLSLLGLVPSPGQARAEYIRVLGDDVLQMNTAQLCRLRGKHIAMIFQNPMTGFNPVRTLGSQLSQAVLRHTEASAHDARTMIIDALRDVGIPSPEQRYTAYPHQMSGGQLQRAMIALAMINQPAMLVADEPTTALDATIQAQILDLMRERVQSCGLILVTHNLGVAAQLCDRVIVIKEGKVVESGDCETILQNPQHPYTQSLLEAAPRFDRKPLTVGLQTSYSQATNGTLLDATDLRVTFQVEGQPLRAVDGVDITIGARETVALVGESGSGKSTAALALMGIYPLEDGKISFDGEAIEALNPAALRRIRKQMQMVLQDPYGSLDPRWTIFRILAEPLRTHKLATTREEIHRRVDELVEQVQLPPDCLDRVPSQFSGGQRQRISIARALALNPRLLIADEPVSALDVSIQAQIVKLLLDIQTDTGISFLIIAHDLALVYQIAHRILVMYLGRVVEEGDGREVIQSPLHPYTTALISAVPVIGEDGRRRIILGGEPPSALDPPSGCAFHPRCPIAQSRCATEVPPLQTTADGRRVACFFPGQMAPAS